MSEHASSSTGSKLVPFLVVLIVIGSFLIGSLYSQVNLLKKGVGTNANAGTPTAPTAADPGVAGQPPAEVKADIDIKGMTYKGDKNAKVAIVEFTDYECPFCGQLFTQTYPELKKNYIDTGKVRYYVMDFPLTSIHPNAQKSAEASHCAADQGKFWEMHDKMFVSQTALKIDDLKKYAADLGLNTGNFNKCLDDGKYAQKVADMMKKGEGYGVTGTPASYVGVIKGDTVEQAIQVSGAVPFASFQTTIEAALAGV